MLKYKSHPSGPILNSPVIRATISCYKVTSECLYLESTRNLAHHQPLPRQTKLKTSYDPDSKRRGNTEWGSGGRFQCGEVGHIRVNARQVLGWSNLNWLERLPVVKHCQKIDCD